MLNRTEHGTISYRYTEDPCYNGTIFFPLDFAVIKFGAIKYPKNIVVDYKRLVLFFSLTKRNVRYRYLLESPRYP